jgi:cytochrome c-type biogenesis protein CcmH/NrfF
MIHSSPGSNRSPGDPETVTLTALLWLLLPLLAVVALIDLATMSRDRRARMLRTARLSQSAIAARLGCSRYRVRLALAVA